MLIYDISNFRHCSNVMREHKSNNIFYVCDINKNCVYQKCYDKVTCSGYRGRDIFLDKQEDLKFLEMSSQDDDWLLKAVEQHE